MRVPGQRDFRLVPLGEEDLPRLTDLCAASAAFFDLIAAPGSAAERAIEILGPLPASVARGTKHVLGVARDGDLVAVVELVEDYPAAAEWFLGLLLVHPDARRSGLGSAVWEHLRLWIQGRRGTTIRLLVQKTNPDARRFWERCDFACTGEGVALAGGPSGEAWRMQRTID